MIFDDGIVKHHYYYYYYYIEKTVGVQFQRDIYN